MECINKLEKEIVDLRKILVEKENELYELKKKWVSKPHLESQLHVNSDGFQNQTQVDRLPKWAIERYSRQILLPEIGVEGQVKLCAARVLVVGAGGLGCPAAVYLAGAGIGEIGLVDYDTVDLTNIHRQFLHTENDQHQSKVQSAADALRRINSNITINQHNVQLDSSNALSIVNKYDVVLDCTDNVPTRYLLNDACVLTKLPLISGSALKMEGQLTVYGYRDSNPVEKDRSAGGGYRGACYRCVFPLPPRPDAVGSCSAHGVAGPVPGLIGDCPEAAATDKGLRLRGRNPDCAACSDTPTITRLLDYETFCKAKAKEKKKEDAKVTSQRRKEQKVKRMSGQSYYGFRKDLDKWVQDVPKSERKLGPACTADFCKKGTHRKCSSFEEERRRKIFNYFWNELDWSNKRKYVRSLVDVIPPKRRTLKNKEVSRKEHSHRYNLLLDEQKLPVCRTTFLHTLGIKEAMVRTWLVNTERPREFRKPLKALNVDAYIDSLPKTGVKCLFCKTTPAYSNLLYLDLGHIKNQFQLYNAYVKDMKMKGVTPASRKTFAKVFLAKDLRIFKPKNDNDVCDIVNEHNVTVNTYNVDGNVELGPNVLHDLDLQILPPFHRTSATELAALMSVERPLLVDVRSAPEFCMCRIDGAVNYPIDTLRGEALERLLGEIREYKGQVTFICRRGNDSQVAARRVLDALPACALRDLAGGLHAWAEHIDRNFPVY
ncbi:hypothetical protein MSG28_016080 [Choristoneura fumiferana]|uniref:Uncharacterized protein n=1 Tax=Choristoneura fumiferana TaxID=7141 RepID=A0ACC0K563_CHOFU|nr:hypothetical protein MSG28_016080 [Choristoneura fumiferana]